MNRSSCASGSGNVPSCSIEFSRRDEEERVGERMGDAVDRDLTLGHPLEQRRLRLWQRTVDLVDDEDVDEDRPRLELKRSADGVPHRQTGDVGRLEIRRALDPPDGGAVDRGRERAGEHRLRGSGDVLEQHVPATDERRDDDLDLTGFAEHDAPGVRRETTRDLDCARGVLAHGRAILRAPTGGLTTGSSARGGSRAG